MLKKPILPMNNMPGIENKTVRFTEILAARIQELSLEVSEYISRTSEMVVSYQVKYPNKPIPRFRIKLTEKPEI